MYFIEDAVFNNLEWKDIPLEEYEKELDNSSIVGVEPCSDYSLKDGSPAVNGLLLYLVKPWGGSVKVVAINSNDINPDPDNTSPISIQVAETRSGCIV